MNNTIDAINARIKEFKYLEFSILSFENNILTIIGSQDIIYYHEFEIVFNKVFTILCNADWRIDTSKTFISIVENPSERSNLNIKFGVEVGNTIFKFGSEDGLIFHVIAEDVEFKDAIVKYYQ